MKTSPTLFALAIAVTLAIATFTSGTTLAGDAKAPEATTKGVISEKSPSALIINGPDYYAISYNISEATQYVDEEGRSVAIEEVKKGAPVEVHSQKINGKMVASKVIVKKTALGHTAITDPASTK